MAGSPANVDVSLDGNEIVSRAVKQIADELDLDEVDTEFVHATLHALFAEAARLVVAEIVASLIEQTGVSAALQLHGFDLPSYPSGGDNS